MSVTVREISLDLGEPTKPRTALIVIGVVIAIGLGAAIAWEPFFSMAAIIGIVFLLLPFFSLELGFYGMAIFLPLPEARVPLGESFTISFSSLIMISLLLSLITSRVVLRRRLLQIQPSKIWPLWLFLLVHFTSMATSVNIGRSINTFLHLIIWTLMLLLTMQVIKNRKMLRNLFILMIAEALIITLFGYYNNYVQKVEISALYHYTGGVAGIFSNRNQYGHYLISILPLAIALGLYSDKLRFKSFGLLAATTIVISIIQTFSRGAWVGALAGITVFSRNWRLWVLGLAAILSIYTWTPENIRMRFRSIWDPTVKSANQSRLLIQLTGLNLILENPLFGVGTGNFEYAAGKERISTLLPRNLSAHNTYLEMAAETGIPGFIALIIFFWFITRSIQGIRIPPGSGPDRMYKLALLSMWISLLTHYTVITAFFNSMPWFLIGVILAASRILNTDESELPTRIT